MGHSHSESVQPSIDVEMGRIVPGEAQRQEINSLVQQANQRILLMQNTT